MPTHVQGRACKTTVGRLWGGRAGWNLLRACESREQARDGGDTPRGNVETTVACCEGRACRPGLHVHRRHAGSHVAGPFSDIRPHIPPCRPRRPRPAHGPCHTCVPEWAPNKDRPCCPSAPPVLTRFGRPGQSETAHKTVPRRPCHRSDGDIRPWQVQWIISAHARSRCGLGLGVAGLTPPAITAHRALPTQKRCHDASAAAEKRARWKPSVTSDHGRSRL